MSIDAAIDVLRDADPEIASGRIFGVELPKSEADLMPRQAVVVSLPVGPEDVGFQQITTDRLDFLCFGEDVTDALDVSVAVHRRLKFFEVGDFDGRKIHILPAQADAVFFGTPIRIGLSMSRRG